MKTTKTKSRVKTSEYVQENSLRQVFETNLRDIYDAELQLVDVLPELAESAYSDDLRDAINDHFEQTKTQVNRIEKIFTWLNIAKENVPCRAMEGLIEEARTVLNEFEESPIRDSALIIALQKIEHYEIAVYGSLCEIANVMGMTKTCDILGRSLDEEEATDRLLTEIAEPINDEAYEVSEGVYF